MMCGRDFPPNFTGEEIKAQRNLLTFPQIIKLLKKQSWKMNEFQLIILCFSNTTCATTPHDEVIKNRVLRSPSHVQK